jgi:hypothetical protein
MHRIVELNLLSAATSAVVGNPSKTPSRVSNGSSMLPGIDGRSAAARRYRDLAMSFAGELGGEAAMTEPEKALVRLAAALTVQGETMQAAIIRGDTVDDEQVVRTANALTRALTQLRRKSRSPKTAAPSLQDYLAKRDAEATA